MFSLFQNILKITNRIRINCLNVSNLYDFESNKKIKKIYEETNRLPIFKCYNKKKVSGIRYLTC